MENSSGVCCGLEVHIKDNQIVNVRPDKASMRSLGGYCCRKGRAMKYFQHNKTGVELSLMKPAGSSSNPVIFAIMVSGQRNSLKQT